MSWRNKLIHGIEGGIGDAAAIQCVNILECANDILESYLSTRNLSVYQVIRRIKGGWSQKAKDAYNKRKLAAKEDARAGKDLEARRVKLRDEIIIDGVRMLKSNIKSQFGMSASRYANVVKGMM